MGRLHAAAYHQGVGCLVASFSQPASDARSGNTLYATNFSQFGLLYACGMLREVGGRAEPGRNPGEIPFHRGLVHAQLASAGGGRIKPSAPAQGVVTGGWWFSTGIVVLIRTPAGGYRDVKCASAWTRTPPSFMARRRTREPRPLLMEDLKTIVGGVRSNGFRVRLAFLF